MTFRAFIQPGSIVVSLRSADRDGAIRELVESLAASGAVDAGAIDAGATDELVAAMIAREDTGTTGIGRGVAAPHCKHPRVRRQVGTVGLSGRGIDFRALDGKPVHIVVALLSPAGENGQHVATMHFVFRHLQEETFRRLLKEADSADKVMELLDEADAG